MGFLVRRLLDEEGLCTLPAEIVQPYGMPLPRRSEETTAIVDTGSASTLVRADIASRLGLVRSGFTLVSGVSVLTPALCETVFADVVLHGEARRIWTVHLRLVIAPGPIGHGLIVGMDSLREGELRVHFPRRSFEFRVPPSP